MYSSIPSIRFCSACGQPVSLSVPPGDNRPRHVCMGCGTVHYSNPKLIVGALPQWQGRVLLCRRAIEPQFGRWTLPAGFMEDHETLADAALRETMEEAGARLELEDLYTVFSVPRISQVHIIYRARLLDLDFAPGEESLEVALFEIDEIPWAEIAFRTIRLTLEHYRADRQDGVWRALVGEIPPN